MKTLLTILFLSASVLGDDRNHTLTVDGRVAVQWRFHEETRVWLSVNSFNGGDWKADGYNPSFTYLRCQYKPVVKKMPDGQWQITFTHEIAEDLP